MTTQPPTTQAGRDSRPLLFIGAGILALLILSVVVVLVAGRGTANYPADSPEGTLQRYLAAFGDGDYDAAYAYFSSRVQEEMSVDDYRGTIAMYGGYQPQQRVLFRGSSGDGDRVRLQLDLEYFYDDGFGGGSSRQPRDVNMVREDGEWRIDDALAGLEPAILDAPF